MKKAVVDFFTAFIIFGIVLLSIAPIANADFFRDALHWDSKNLTLYIFDTSFTLDRQIPYAFNELLCANDLFFGKGFSQFVKYAIGFLGDFAGDFLVLSYNFTKDITGAA